MIMISDPSPLDTDGDELDPKPEEERILKPDIVFDEGDRTKLQDIMEIFKSISVLLLLV